MDGSTLEHSDSDSGESWTLLDNTPAYADEAPVFSENHPQHERQTENNEKDEDTDGISIISDSDRESTTPCDLTYDKCLLEEVRPTETHAPDFVSVNPVPSNNNEDHESVRSEDDFLGDGSGKLKTYVHRRNKRLSTVLNIIVLGSVITAAGVAIGHMWGAKNDCTMHNAPSVNKILSNLYKLQEENAYLRNKLKELTLINNIHMQHRKIDTEKVPVKPHKCRKVFEEPLSNRNANKFIKCVDSDINSEKMLLESHSIQPDYEKEFLSDIDKLKNIYQQNKSWLDEEIAKRMKNEDSYIKKLKNNLKSPKSIRINEEHKSLNDESAKKRLVATAELPSNAETVINVTEPLTQSILNVHEGHFAEETLPAKRVTYADSLKSVHKIAKRDTHNEYPVNRTRQYTRKRKPHKEYDTISENSVSEEELRKDDRYTAHKQKMERKKNDRQKIHKKQKRRNKYEQWEMKGGYMKDYDDFSITSAQENEFTIKNPDKNFLSQDFERNNYISQFSETDENIKSTDFESDNKLKSEKPDNRTNKHKDKGKKNKELNWYEKRAALRNDARKRLEQELFGESTPNNAGWYFRRMQRREQCRIKGDNSTYKRLSKRINNFKTKH